MVSDDDDDDERKKRNDRGALVEWSGEMGVIYVGLLGTHAQERSHSMEHVGHRYIIPVFL